MGTKGAASGPLTDGQETDGQETDGQETDGQETVRSRLPTTRSRCISELHSSTWWQ
jgi:hypothetical protein